MELFKGLFGPLTFSYFYLMFCFELVYSFLLDLSWPLLPTVYEISLLFSGLDGSCLVTISCNYLGVFLVYSIV